MKKSDNYYSQADAGYPMWQMLMIGGYVSAPKCRKMALHNRVDPVAGEK